MTSPTALINSIPILEAQASSEIENIVTTADDLFKYAQDASSAANPATKETLNYRTALFAGVGLVAARPLSASSAKEICATIRGRQMGVRKLPGTYIGNPATHGAIYTPPVGVSVIREKLSARLLSCLSSPTAESPMSRDGVECLDRQPRTG